MRIQYISDDDCVFETENECFLHEHKNKCISKLADILHPEPIGVPKDYILNILLKADKVIPILEDYLEKHKVEM
jgi:hypothetical protein